MKALSLILLALVLCLVSLPAAEKLPVPPGVKNASVEEFDKLRAEKNAVVLDVRTEKEFKEGHIPGAVNLDVNGPDFAKKVAALDKGKTYLMYCAHGKRGLKACGIMKDAAFTNVVNLEPGLSEWEKAGKPVKKK